MSFAAISYNIRPDTEAEIAEIFSATGFRRTGSPVVYDAAGNEVGLIPATGLFIGDDSMVRIIQYLGELDDVARHMSRQTTVKFAEQRLSPFLAEPRDTQTEQGFLRYFANSLMTDCGGSSTPDRLARITVLRFRHPDAGPADLALESRVPLWAGPGHPDGPALLAERWYRNGESVVRLWQHTGELRDVARLVARDAAAFAREAVLLDALSGGGLRPTEQSYPDIVGRLAMRCLSQLAMHDSPAGEILPARV
ncbi:SchA/CurD-like domain-containing protein [Amycolatopsis tolypomycina]|uniref:SchA/CurD like domain-containing protein n=1 Tax=Amycolatopsis tolypomycina TaxID=208445 RepID=A0A1H4TWW4_9PSEU|nr:SchA/CurD-like domain-containing protein [Amycolatopsis tolypomycina]SEC61013.1 SchA/CurD like domain-containing protein [Amycolatopsis tolypomycina]